MQHVDLEKENQELRQKVSELQQQLADAQCQLTHFKALSEGDGHQGELQSKRFKMVTVMYANIIGFDKLQNADNAQGLADDLDVVWVKINEIVSK